MFIWNRNPKEVVDLAENLQKCSKFNGVYLESKECLDELIELEGYCNLCNKFKDDDCERREGEGGLASGFDGVIHTSDEGMRQGNQEWPNLGRQ